MTLPIPVVNIIPSESASTPSPPFDWVKVIHGCFATETLWYYDCVAFNHNPSGIYSYLVAQANELIQVWDPYIHPEDAILFENIRGCVMLQVLTCKGQRPPGIPPKIAEFKQRVESCLFKENLDVRFHNEYDGIGNPFHDRYLFVDGKGYKVGASLEYYRSENNSSCAIVQVDGDAYTLLEDRFQFFWTHNKTRSV